jgi:serine/threonine protein phosphatase PrpC
MPVVCPSCGGTSQDVEFCDHCNVELTSPASPLAPIACPLGPDLLVPLTPEQGAILSHPAASVLLETPEQLWRVHWIGSADWPILRPFLAARQALSCSCLPPCRLIEDQGGVWLAAEVAGRPAEPWRDGLATEPRERLRQLVEFLEPFAAALEELHAAGLVWLSFDPGALELLETEETGRRLRFTNLDLRIFPKGASPERLEVSTAYAAPEVCRFQVEDLGPRTDVFHLGMFAYYWLTDKLLPAGFAGSGLEAFGFALPPLRVFAPDLPPGVAPVIARAVEVEPARRTGSARAFWDALREALHEAEDRWASVEPVRWETGAQTRTGRCKEALGLQNEDAVVVSDFEESKKCFLAVADGISICDVGSGRLASSFTCLVLEAWVDEECTAELFPEQITAACRHAGEVLLGWAREQGHTRALEEGSSLMGTTLTAAWLEGNRAQLANIGDSRAYLVRNGLAEQLTVDGDVACALWAMGMPPEEVQELGRFGRALHGCIGSLTADRAGGLRVQDAACKPRLLTLPLLPGDVLVLCSDGLVDEGVALEPSEVAELVSRHAELPADELALQLVEAADQRQRLPTALEPDGFGDNITCIVVKIAGSREQGAVVSSQFSARGTDN